MGIATRTCELNDTVGVWSGDVPICSRKYLLAVKILMLQFYYLVVVLPLAILCTNLTSPKNGGINFTMDSFTDFSLETNATYYCDHGFSLNGNKAMRTCEQDDQLDTRGVWSGVAPTCYGKTGILGVI